MQNASRHQPPARSEADIIMQTIRDRDAAEARARAEKKNETTKENGDDTQNHMTNVQGDSEETPTKRILKDIETRDNKVKQLKEENKASEESDVSFVSPIDSSAIEEKKVDGELKKKQSNSIKSLTSEDLVHSDADTLVSSKKIKSEVRNKC